MIARSRCEELEARHPSLVRDDKSAWAKLKGPGGKCYRQLSDPVRRVESTVIVDGMEPVDPPRGSIVAALRLSDDADLETYERLLVRVAGEEAKKVEEPAPVVEEKPWTPDPVMERYVQEEIRRWDEREKKR